MKPDLLRMPLIALPTIVYRGVKWSAERGASDQWIQIFTHDLFNALTCWGYATWPGDVDFYVRIEQIADKTLREITHDKRLVSIDGVPWEIHMISDESAYQVALEAYQTEQIHDILKSDAAPLCR